MFLCLTLASPSQAQVAAEAEVLHWWYRGGDRKAMNVLINEFERRGGTWYDVSRGSPEVTLNSAVSRITKGYTPTLIQWNSGWEVEQFHKLGLLNSISDKRKVSRLKDRFIDSVLDIVTVDGSLVAIPVTLHSENRVWHLPDPVLHAEENGALKDWDSLIEYARELEKNNITAIAIGTDPWQRRILFNNVLLGIAGPEYYYRLYEQLDATVLQEAVVQTAFSTYISLVEFSKSFGDGRWDQQVAAVASNKAKLLFMGDWTRGEFRNLGLRHGRGYKCSASPSTQRYVIPVIDLFVLGKVTSDEESQGQSLFLDVVTDSDTSEAFNYLKGSLPPLSGLQERDLDPCNQLSYDALQTEGGLLKPFAGHGDRGFLDSMEQAIYELWAPNISLEMKIKSFEEHLLFEQYRRGLTSIASSTSE